MGKRLHVETWGCQMNLHQSEGMIGLFLRAGYTLVDSITEADVVLFNGCMVREKAEEKVYGRIGAIVEEKRRRRLIFGVGGCLGQIHREALLSRFPAIDFVFGSTGHEGLLHLVERAADGERPVGVGGAWRIDETPPFRLSPVTAMVTIAEGCSNFCSYCIVPFARGPLRSRAPELILAEVEEALASGHREVLLLGQNVDSYGRDSPQYGDFSTLLREVARTGVERIRFISSHPRDMTEEVLETVASHRNICRHLHLACQSGSDRVLASMRRGYTRERFLSIVRRARDIVPGINITTDIIVGYPRESECDFEATMELLEEGRFGSVFVAMYSPRPLTESAKLPDDVPSEVKQERLQRVLDLQRKIALEENERFIGQKVDVLIEGEARNGAVYGRADDHRTVVLAGDLAPGDLITVRIEAATPSTLFGTAPVVQLERR